MESSINGSNSTRKRRQDYQNNEIVENKALFQRQSSKSKGHVFDGQIIVAVLFIFYTLFILFVRHRVTTFPEPLTQYANSPNDTFYETNARIHLKHFSLHGPRVVGSDANEIFAYRYILEELAKIKKNALPSKELEVTEHNVTGAFDITFLSDFVSVYRNIKNIIVRLKSETGSEHSLLMSCHFDSAVESPGAGDNAISCSVMLEVLRVFSMSQEKINHNIIFLFNGAEENLLQASHGFITQHPWVDSIKAFVNIDSAGAGGWEVVFQTGPAHPWLVRAYAESSPYPSGSIFGQEMFQSGLIPSDTDYRIYRDFGEIPGLDIAYITNGYVYHTKLDQNRFIHAGCVQRGGENLLALLRKLSSSPHLADPGDEKEGSMVFFDLIGYIMIFYPHSVGTIINSALVAAVLFKVIRKSFNLDRNENHDTKYFRNLVLAMGCVAISWVLIVVTCVVMALLMTVLGHNLTWFTHVYNVVPLFVLPSTIAVILLHDMFSKTIFKMNSAWYNEQIFFEANLTIWGFILLLLTIKGIGSAFIPMLYVVGPLFIRDRTLWISKKFNWRNHPVYFLLLHLAGQLLPSLVITYVTYCVLMLFVPIMGRLGTEINPDIAIGIMTSLMIILISGYMISLLYLCHGLRKVVGILAAVTLVWLLALTFTRLGFPYSGDHDQPSPMRLLAVHSVRRKYDMQGVQTYKDSGLWMISFDYSHFRHLRDHMPILQKSRPATCGLGPYCGLPYLIPVIALFHPEKGLLVQAEGHNRPAITCKLINRVVDPAAFTALTFEVVGPDHFSMTLRPHGNVSLVRYSFVREPPAPALMPPDMADEINYYVYYSHGETPATPWTFSIYLKVPSNHDPGTGLIDIAFSGHYLHESIKHTPPLDSFIADLPDWVSPISWPTTWDGYTF